MSGAARKQKQRVKNEPMVVLSVPWSLAEEERRDAWLYPFASIVASGRNMMQAFMLNEERHLLFHDGRRRFANWPSSLVYPIYIDTNKCRYECRCYLEKREDEPCQY